jgi:hypothetical protein
MAKDGGIQDLLGRNIIGLAEQRVDHATLDRSRWSNGCATLQKQAFSGNFRTRWANLAY